MKKLFIRVQALMMETGYTQDMLARYLRKSKTYVSNRMTGRYSWDIDDIYALCDLFKLDYHTIPEYFPRGGQKRA